MTKADLVDKIHNNTGLTKDEAFAYLETILETIKKALATAETVKITGFRSFVVRQKAARRGRNPLTGEPITITPRKVLTFKPSIFLKNALNQSTRVVTSKRDRRTAYSKART
ncbi:MAG TPA: integration host factor subunit alpha [Geobacteraceae bacterium]|nr:integration host factor subunit alpha [Geobacteraceae bacterium]